MLLARERPYKSPTSQRSGINRSSLMTPPPLSPRRMGSDSVTKRTLMVSRSLSPSLLLPMDLEQADDTSFRRSLFALKPRNASSSATQQPTAAEPAGLPVQTQATRPVLVTPRCQPLSTRKRQRQDESDNEGEEEDEEVRNVNVPKKLMLCLDD